MFTLGQLSGEFMPTYIKLIPLFSAICAVIAVFYVYELLALRCPVQGAFARYLTLYRFLSHKWGFDVVYNQFINIPLMHGAYNVTFALIDKGLLEAVGPTGAGRQAIGVGRLLVSAQTGRVYDYASFMLAALYLALLLTSSIGV